MGKLKTFQIYDRFKVRARLAKLNSESLRKAHTRLWARLETGEEDFATDLSQVLLISHLDMIAGVLNFLNIPHQDGFFEKDLKPEQYLTEGWQERAYQKLQGQVSEVDAALLHKSPRLGTHQARKSVCPRRVKRMLELPQ